MVFEALFVDDANDDVIEYNRAYRHLVNLNWQVSLNLPFKVCCGKFCNKKCLKENTIADVLPIGLSYKILIIENNMQLM